MPQEVVEKRLSEVPVFRMHSLSAGTAGDPKSSVFASVMNLSNTILGAGALATTAFHGPCALPIR